MAVTSPAPSIRVPNHAPLHRHLLMASTVARSDLDFPSQPPEATSAPPPSPSSTADGDLLAGVIDLLEFEQAEPQQRNAELRRMREPLHAYLHDAMAASAISLIAEREWNTIGDDDCDWPSPYCMNPIGGHDLVSMEYFNLYFKGLLAEDENRSTLGAIGVVICDSTNSVLLKASKPLAAAEVEGRGELADLTALIHDLGFAFCLGLQRITFHCDDHSNFLYLTRKQKPMEAKVAELLDSADHIRKGFSDCSAARTIKNDQSQLLFELVTSSILQQRSGLAENKKQKPTPKSTHVRLKAKWFTERRKGRLKVKRRAEKKRRQRFYHNMVEACDGVYRRDRDHALKQFIAKLGEERANNMPSHPIPVPEIEMSMSMSILPVKAPSALDRYRSILDEHFKDGNQWQIVMSRQLFHYDHFDVPIGKSEIVRWLDQDEIEACHVSVYIRYLVENHCTGVKDMFGFLCPNRISPGYVGGSVEDRAEYVAKAMEGNIRNKIFFGPYNLGGHWVLIVFSPQLDYAYWIDSLHGPIRQDAMRLVDLSHALKYTELGGVKPRLTTQWRRIECPVQSNLVDCGYYVLRFIREIIEQRYLHIPCNWYDQKTTYTQAEIDEIRTEWMEFVLDLNT